MNRIVEKVIELLYENYIKAVKQEFMQKPISYALYQTWKYDDSIEKGDKEWEK